MSAFPAVAPAVLPVPLAIVPAEEVEPAIAAAHAELAALEAELARILAEAEALEAHGGDEPFDHPSHEFVAVRVQRFLDGLRAEANGELDALLAVAGQRRPRPTLRWTPLFAERSPSPVVPGPVETAPAGPVPAAPVPVAVPTVPVVDPTRRDAAPPVDHWAPPTPERLLEAEFWSDETSPGGWGHVRRTLRAVGWQAVAVLLVVAAVLVRVG